MSERDDLAAQAREEICDFDGHEWGDAGGGLLICLRCEEEAWADYPKTDRTGSPASGGHDGH